VVQETTLRGWATSAIIIGLITSSVALAKPPVDACWQAAELDAFKIRALQSQLMVATLKCSALGNTTVTEAYNRFVTSSQQMLRTSATVLLTRYKRLNGRDATKIMDSLTTDMANRYSGSSMGPNACVKAGEIADMAARVTSSDLAALAHSLVATGSDSVMCAIKPN
jgi:hypothetical protein